MKIINEIERDAPLTNVEKAALGLFALWPLIAIIAIGALCNGCAYKGGKVVDYKVVYTDDYLGQMLEYCHKYSTL